MKNNESFSKLNLSYTETYERNPGFVLTIKFYNIFYVMYCLLSYVSVSQ